MHERKSYTLSYLCVQYQLPYGMVGKIPAEDIKCGGRGISALIINKNNKTVFIQFLLIKSCIQHYKKKICSIFYCEVFDIMVSYMYERKSYTLPHLCVILITIWYGQ